MIPDVDPLDLVDPARFARNGYPHAVWTRLRNRAPVAHFEPPGYRHRPAPKLSRAGGAELVALLEHRNAWHTHRTGRRFSRFGRRSMRILVSF